MKSIKSLSLFFLIALANFSLSSCEKEYVSELQTLSFSDMSFEVSGGLQEQVFTNHDLSNYSIKSSDTWITARIDVEHSIIYVKADENTSYDSRTGKVTVSDFKDGVSTKSFNVTQDYKKGLIVDKDKYTIGMDGGEIAVIVNKNVDYEVTIPTDVAKWVSVLNKAGSRGLVPSTLTLKVERNRTGDERNGTIKISNSKEGLEQTISIKQSFEPSFSVTPLSFEFDELEHQATVNVHANFMVYPYCDDGWLHYERNGKETDDDFTYTLYVESFFEKSPKRTTTFVVDNKQMGESAEVTITQYRTLYLKSEGKVLEVGQYVALEGDGEVVNTKEIPVIYESTDTTVATVTDYGRVNAVGEGSCTVSVSSKDGKYGDYMYITVNKAYVPTDYLTAEWEYEYSSGKVSAVSSTFINSSKSTVYLRSYALYNDSIRADSTLVASSEFSRTVPAGSYYSLSKSIAVDSSKPYHIEWVFTCENKDYMLVLDQDKIVTISSLTAAASRRATSRRQITTSRRSRSRR